MSNHDTSRRDFLVRTIAGAGAVAAGVATPAAGQSPEAGAANAPAHSEMHRPGVMHGAFLNHEDSLTVAAFTERLMPGAPGKPGARDADVLNYIDLALAGAYSDLQDFYRRGLAQLDAHCRARFQQSFVHLTAAQMDEVISDLEHGKAAEFLWPSAQEFFNTVRVHTFEGMFADPLYGGNKDFAGWRLVGFPGAQAIFTPADLQDQDAFVRAPIVGLQSVAADSKRR
jgi:gluconate 2-dehydrogenase gamma chain